MATNVVNVGNYGQWRIYVDQISQNAAANTSVVRVRAYMINNSPYGTSFNNNSVGKSVSGSASWSGSGPFSVPGGTSLLFIDVSFTIGHNSDGTRTVSFTASLGNTGTSVFGSGGSVSVALTLTRIPKRPSPPGTPKFSNVMPTSVTVSWTGSSNNGGSAVTSYLLRRWNNAAGTGSYYDSSANNLSRSVTGLTPGQSYRFVVYARNGSADNSGYSNPSGAAVVQLLAGAWVKVNGVWKLAVPYVRVAGVWKMATPYVRSGGVWKLTN